MNRLFALLIISLMGCTQAHAYMMPIIEVRCPMTITKADCMKTIEQVCRSSYLIVMSRRESEMRVFEVSCEAER
jgi:hypothetical protein